MKKVFKFVKGKREEKKEHALQQCVFPDDQFRRQNVPEANANFAAELNCGYTIDTSGKDKTVTKLHKAAWQGNVEKLKVNLKKIDVDITDKLNRTPLHLAAANGHSNVVWFLLNNKAKLNICDNEGKVPFLKAIEGGHKDTVQLMLERGADINTIDYSGNSALHVAAMKGLINISSMLLKQGANFEIANNIGEYPLHIATQSEHKDLVELLLRYGSSVNIVDRENRSPLMFAAKSGNMPLVQLFLEYGAQLGIMDCNDWTAEDYALLGGHHEVALELKTPSHALVLPYHETVEKREDVKRSISSVSISESQSKHKDKVVSSGNMKVDGIENNVVWSNRKEMDSNFKCKSTGLNLSNFLHTSDDDVSEASQEPRTPGRKEEDSPRSCVIPPPCKPPRSWDLIQSGVIDDPQCQEPRRRSFLLFGSLRSKRESFVESQQGTDYDSLLGDCAHGDSDLWIMSQSFSKYNDKPMTQSQNVSKADGFNDQNSQTMRNIVEKSDNLVGNNDACKSDVIAMEFSKDSLKDSSSDDWDSDDSLPMDNCTAVICVENASPVKEKNSNESQNICESSNISSEKRGRLLVRAPSIDLTDDDGQHSKEKSNSSKSSSENDKAQTAESDVQPSANKEISNVVHGSLETDGTLGREGTLMGYEELWESNPHLVIQAMDFPGTESKSVIQKSIQEEMDEAEAQANSLLFASFPNPKIVDSTENKNILREDLSPGNKSIEDTLIFKSPMLEQKTKTPFNDENLMTLAPNNNTELSKRSNQKFESRSLDDLDECVVNKGLSEIKMTRARKHSRQQSISVLSWSKSEEIYQKPPTTNFSRLVADNKHINAQLQCYDEAIRELAQVSMVKKQTSLPLPQKSELWDPGASRFFGVKNQRYLSLPRTNELIDEAFKEIGESSVKLKQSSRSLPRTITAKHIYLEGDRISFPRQKKSTHRRRRAESEGETFANTSVNNTDRENSLEISTYQPKRVESDSSLLKPICIPPTFLKDDTISPNGSETPRSDLSSSSVREHSKEKPLRKKRKALLAMRCLKGQHKELLNGNTMACISVEETLDKPLFWLSSDKRNSLEHQVTVIERPTLKPRSTSPIKLEEADIVSGTVSPLADSDDSVPPLPPPLSFMTPGSPPADLRGNKESQEGIIGSTKCTNVSENQLLQSEFEEHKIADQKDSQSDGDSEQSQIDSIPMKKHHTILKEQLQVATLKHGQLQQTTAELGEKAEQLRYELAEAHETARSQGEVVFLLKEQLANMETIHATCLEDAHLTQLRIANLEQELSHLQDVCQKSSEDQFQLNQMINSRNVEIAQLLKIVEEKCDAPTQLVKESDETHIPDYFNKVKDENSCLQGEVVALHDKNDELLIELENMKQKYLTLLEDKNESSSGFQKNQVPQQMDHDTFVKYHKILHELKELWSKEFDCFNKCKEQLEKYREFENEESAKASLEINHMANNIFMEIQKSMDICQEFHNKIEIVLSSGIALPSIKEASTLSLLPVSGDDNIYLPDDDVQINAIQSCDNENHSNKEETEQFLLTYKSELHTFEEELNNILKKINMPIGPESLIRHCFLSLIKLKPLVSKADVSQSSQSVKINEMSSPDKHTMFDEEIINENYSEDIHNIIDKVTQENQKLKDELQERYKLLDQLTTNVKHLSDENHRLVLCLKEMEEQLNMTAPSLNDNSGEHCEVPINPSLSEYERHCTVLPCQSQYSQTENNSESLFQEIIIENANLKLELQKAKIEFEELEKELKAIVLMKEPSITLNTVDPQENDELRRKVKELEQVISKQEEELNGCESDSLKILEMSQHSHVPGIYDQLYQENLELTAQLQAMKDEKDELEISYRTLIEDVKQNNLVDSNSIVHVNDISLLSIPNNNEKNETINGCKHKSVMNEGTPDLKNNNIAKSCTSECKCVIKSFNEGILNNSKLNDDDISTSLLPQSIKKACVKELGQSLKILEFTKENRASCNKGKQNILHSTNSSSIPFTENTKKLSKLKGSCSFECKTSCENDSNVNLTTASCKSEEHVYEESTFQQACISVEKKNLQHSEVQTIVRNAETDLSHNRTDDVKDELAVNHHGHSNKCNRNEGDIKCSLGNKKGSSKICKSPNKSNIENVRKRHTKSPSANRCCMSESDIKKLSSFTTSVKCAQSLTGCDQRNTYDNCAIESELKVTACSSSLVNSMNQLIPNNVEFGSENYEKKKLKCMSSENITNESLSFHQKNQRKNPKELEEKEFMSTINDSRQMAAGSSTSPMTLGHNYFIEKHKQLHDGEMVTHGTATVNLDEDSSRVEDHEISISSTETESDTDSKTLSSRCSEQVFCICQPGENCQYCINLRKMSENSIDPEIGSFKSRKVDIFSSDCKCRNRDKDIDIPERKTAQNDYMKEHYQEETKEKSSLICSINDAAGSSQIKGNLSNNTKRSDRHVYKQSRIPTYTRGIGSSGNESSPSQSMAGIRKNGKYSFSSKQRKSFSESESSASTNTSDLICKSNRDVATNTSDLNATHDLQKELQTEKERVRKHAQSIKKLKSELQQMKSRVNETKKSGKLESNILTSKYKLYSSSAPHSPMHYDLSLAEFQRQVNELQQKVKEEHSLRFSLEVQVNKMRYELQEKFQLEKELSLLRNQLEKEFVSKAEIELLKKSYETALNKAKQDAELCIRDDFSSKLSQINNFIEKQVQEQAHIDHLRNSESQLRQDCQETHLKLLSDLAKVQVTLHEKGEKEKELREKYERLSKECERKQELRTKKLVEKSYNVNLTPYSNSKDKDINSKGYVLDIHSPIHSTNLQSVPISMNISSVNDNWMQENSLGQMLRWELEKNIRKHSRADQLSDQPCGGTTLHESDDHLELLKNKYFLH